MKHLSSTLPSLSLDFLTSTKEGFSFSFHPTYIQMPTQTTKKANSTTAGEKTVPATSSRFSFLFCFERKSLIMQCNAR
jgi:hypothetical protein